MQWQTTQQWQTTRQARCSLIGKKGLGEADDTPVAAEERAGDSESIHRVASAL
jgi:hypothetical protein